MTGQQNIPVVTNEIMLERSFSEGTIIFNIDIKSFFIRDAEKWSRVNFKDPFHVQQFNSVSSIG